MKTVTITSKNQVTLPIAQVRQAKLTKGAKLNVRRDGKAFILEPERDFSEVMAEVRAHIKPYIKRPLTDAELQAALHEWPKD